MRQLSRRIATVLAISLGMLSLSALPALAGNLQPDVVLSLTPSVQSVRPGQQFTVSVFLQMPTATPVTPSPHLIDSLLMSIHFDPAVLEAVNFQPVSPFMILEGPVIDNSAGTAALAIDTGPDVTNALQGAAAVATITFSAKSGDHGVSPINWLRAQALSASSNDAFDENVVGVADGTTVCVDSAVIACKPLAPALSIPRAQLGSDSVKVRLAWGAVDANGISAYQLQQSTNGGTFTTVSLPSATTTSVSPMLTSGSYRYQVRFTDGLGHSSNYAIGPAFEFNGNGDSIGESFALRLYDDTTMAAAYSKGWATKTLSGAYGGGVHSATGAGATVKFRVRNTLIAHRTGVAQAQSLAWVSTVGPDRGMAEVLFDGVKVATVDLYAPTTTTREVVWSRNVDPSRSHVLEILVLGRRNPASAGNRVDVDGFVLLR